MQRQKLLNYIAVLITVVLLAVWTHWLFRLPTMPFVLRARWKLQGIGFSNVAFSPKGDLLAISMLPQNYSALTVSFWKVPEGMEVGPKIVVSPNARFLSCLHQVAFSPDGRLLAVGYNERGLVNVGIFSVTDGHRVQTITISKATPDSFLWLIFAPDGRLVVGLDALDVWFINVADGRKTKAPFTAKDIAFSPDARFMAAIDSRPILIASQRHSQSLNSVTVYNTNSQSVKQLKIAKAAFIPFGGIAFSKDGQKLMCTWVEERTKRKRFYGRVWVSVWRTKDWQLEWSVPLTPFYNSEVNFTLPAIPAPDVSSVALVEPDPYNLDGLLWLFAFIVNKLQKQSEPMAPARTTLRRLEDGKLITRLPRHGYVESPIAFSPDGRFLVVFSENEIALWERKGSMK